jgi:hypothetical protein
MIFAGKATESRRGKTSLALLAFLRHGYIKTAAESHTVILNSESI